MPTRKKDNKKNLPQESRDRAIVPPKEDSSKNKLTVTKTARKEVPQVNAGTTSGKKKKPKI